MILVLVDTTGIQPYIFGSNRLQENIGASLLVARATGDWASEHAALCRGTEVYAGGGNFLVTFEDKERAGEFVRGLSRQALECAPGLQLVTAEVEFANEAGLAGAVRAGFAELAAVKQCRPVSAPLLGLSVTRTCSSTGLPAIEAACKKLDDAATDCPASSEVHAKTGQVRAANDALNTLFGNLLNNTNYAFPRDFDELGRSAGEHSYVAVVHADGNGIGKLIQEKGRACERDGTNYREVIPPFLQKIEEAGRNALRDTLAALLGRLKQDGGAHINLWAGKERDDLWTAIELKSRPPGASGHYLPFRPLVFGGDDITFVCDGRLGLPLATLFLKSFEERTKGLAGGEAGLSGCAGIAIAQSHYPFARNYALSEELCRSAKKFRAANEISGSCLDWHFAQSGLSGTLEAIRQREYTAPNGRLEQRPVTLDKGNVPSEILRSWPAVREATLAFQRDWADKRIKMKTLRAELRMESPAVERFLAKADIDALPNVIPAATNLSTTGWWDKQCAYFDVIELSDWFIDLEGSGPVA